MRFLQLIVLAAWPYHAIAVVADDPVELLRQANANFVEQKYAEAVALATQAITDESAPAEAYRLRAGALERLGKFKQAIGDLDIYIERQPNLPDAYQARGELHFRAGNIRESIADFDRFLLAYPAREPHHWQRGISYYYADQFEKGVAQFELHKSVNPQDVENAIWHYLCKARVDGVKAARAALIDIDRDRRPWAMTVYRMFQGRVTPEQALEHAEQVSTTDAGRNDNRFYTHLYVGLLHEADGRTDEGLKHIRTANKEYPSSHYMGDVARVHLQLAEKADR